MYICSSEHMVNIFRTVATSAPQAAETFRATRIKSMAEAEEKLKPIRAILEAIREKADYALKQLQEAEEERSLRWRCKGCRWVKHFTKPVPFEAAGKCPRCKSIEFEAVA